MTNYTQRIRINETRSALERTVLAAEERSRRAMQLDPISPRDAARWHRRMVDGASAEELLSLSVAQGSLTGLVLAAEGMGP